MKLKLVFITALLFSNILFAQQNQIGSTQKPEIIKQSDSFEKVLMKIAHQKLQNEIRKKTIKTYFAEPSLKSASAATTVNKSDSLALVALFNSTDGPNWIDNTNWLTGPVSAWHGITVESDRVIRIELYQNNLVGTIPVELGQLTELKWLFLFANQLTGSIPVEIGELINLLDFDLYDNQLTGTIPVELFQLTNLLWLDLGENQLMGTIPVEVFKLKDIEFLTLNGNEFTGSIPVELAQLTKLTFLQLGENQLSGNIPQALFQLTNLVYLNLGENQLTGTIPADLGQLTNLKYLFLGDNQFTGTIPAELWQMTNLSSLSLGWNQFTGTIPVEIGQLSNLEALFLDGNLLTGTIPMGLGQLTNLKYLFLSGNQLSGSIPADLLGQLTNLEYIFLYGNQFTGSIPAEIGQLSNLKYLYLGENQFTGSVPAEISQMANLQIIDFRSNQLDVMPDLTAPASLTGLDISDNKITFEDIEYNMDLLTAVNFVYQPQDSVGETKKITKTAGENLSYKLITGGNHNKYQWYHNGAKLDTQTSATLEISNLNTQNSGKYHCEVTNDMVNDLVLTSRILTLTVQNSNNYCKYLVFKPGWNIFSTPILTQEVDIMKLFQLLIFNKSLVKIQDEGGNSMEDWGTFGGWKNYIGNIVLNKGYKIKVTVKDSVLVCGFKEKFPYAIPLNTGWNIMGYPHTDVYNAQDVVQQLIDRGTLVKVQDEGGNSLEDWGFFGGWKNNIGDFTPGKGFKIKASAKDTLWIYESYLKSSAIKPELVATSHFQPKYKGNGINHMNINLINLSESGIIEGDEIGIFDGELCVGSARISNLQSLIVNQSSISIPVSATDGIEGKNGYSEGNPIILKLFRNGVEYPLTIQLLNPSKTVFEKGGSLFAQVDLATGLEGIAGSNTTQINCYPNPFSDEVTFEISLAADAKIQVEVMNQLGQRVKMIATKQLLPGGLHKLTWDGRNSGNGEVAPGIYHVRIEIDGEINFKKVIYSKIE